MSSLHRVRFNPRYYYLHFSGETIQYLLCQKCEFNDSERLRILKLLVGIARNCTLCIIRFLIHNFPFNFSSYDDTRYKLGDNIYLRISPCSALLCLTQPY